jgi:hypothetical protein
MSDMKRCLCCGVVKGSYEEHNKEYTELVDLVLQCGDERQLLKLSDIMRNKITTCVTTSIGKDKLAYEEEDLWHVQVMVDALSKLRDKLQERQ